MNCPTLTTNPMRLRSLRQWLAHCLDHLLPPASSAPDTPLADAVDAPDAPGAPPCSPACDKPQAPAAPHLPPNQCMGDDPAILLAQQALYKRQLEDLLVARRYAVKNLMRLVKSRQHAFEATFSGGDDITRFNTEPEQAGLAHFTTLLLECNKTAHELHVLDHSLIRAFQMLMANRFEAACLRIPMPHLAQR